MYNGPDRRACRKVSGVCGGPSGFHIFDITDPGDVTLIGSSSYDTPHYGHQVWVPETHDHAFFGDELDELNEGGPTRTVVFDLTDLDAPVVAELFEASVEATDHNQYNHGEWLFQSNYASGLRMLSDAWPMHQPFQSRVILILWTTPTRQDLWGLGHMSCCHNWGVGLHFN